MKKEIFLLGAALALVSFQSCRKDHTDITGGEEGDSTSIVYEGKTYPVKYLNKWWMLENLAYLPSVTPKTVWSDTEPHCYVYGYDGTSVLAAKATDNYKNYGVLYNWLAAQTACPPGWHLATDQDWKDLEFRFGMDYDDLDKIGARNDNYVGYWMKSTSGWEAYATDTGDGEDLLGFNVKPAGYYLPEWSYFGALNFYALFWTSTLAGERPYSRLIAKAWNGVARYNDYAINSGMSVRCVKDE